MSRSTIVCMKQGRRVAGFVVRTLATAVFVIVIGSVAAAEGPRVTDDPQGRVFIPLEESLDPVGNVAVEGGSYDPESSLEATAREKVLQTESASSPLVIPAAAFTADGSNPDSMFFPFGGGYFSGDSENYGCMVAPAYLPQGAEITDMYVSVYDDDSAFDISVNLRKVDNFNGGAAVSMASASTSGQFAGIQTISDYTIVEPVVLYPDYSYYVTTCVLSGSIRLYSVRLYY